MRSRLLTIIRTLASVVTLACAAQALSADVAVTVHSHQTTTPIQSARFEIVQSTLSAKWTFRLDRFTGKVWQFVITQGNDSAWQEMQVIDAPKLNAPTRPRFQIINSGLSARYTFLTDVDTGKTWQLTTFNQKTKEGAEIELHGWQPFVGL